MTMRGRRAINDDPRTCYCLSSSDDEDCSRRWFSYSVDGINWGLSKVSP